MQRFWFHMATSILVLRLVNFWCKINYLIYLFIYLFFGREEGGGGGGWLLETNFRANSLKIAGCFK